MRYRDLTDDEKNSIIGRLNSLPYVSREIDTVLDQNNPFIEGVDPENYYISREDIYLLLVAFIRILT